jgi:hypothetical protein
VFPNIGDFTPGVKRQGTSELRAQFAPPPTAAAKVAGFAQVPHELTARPGLSDAAFRAWTALQRWAWRGAQPSNAELALACGWITRAGSPSISKAKRALRELEDARLIERVVTVRDGRTVRERIRIHGTPDRPASGPGAARPRAIPAPGGGSDLTRGGGPNPAPSETRSRKTVQELPRIGAGEGDQGTTTKGTSPVAPSPAAVPPTPPQVTGIKPALTVGQRAFLASLTAAERERFDALPVKARGKHLAMFTAGGDETIRRHVLATLKPPRERGAIPTPEDDVPTLLAAVGEGRSPNAALSLAGRLARELGDHKSFRYYLARAEEAATGKRPLESLADAYRQSRNPRAKNPGALFVHALGAWDNRSRAGQGGS